MTFAVDWALNNNYLSILGHKMQKAGWERRTQQVLRLGRCCVWTAFSLMSVVVVAFLSQLNALEGHPVCALTPAHVQVYGHSCRVRGLRVPPFSITQSSVASVCFLFFFFLCLFFTLLSNENFPMGNLGRFPQGKPAATELRYPNLINS